MPKKVFTHPHERSHYIRKKLTLGLIIMIVAIAAIVWGLLTTMYVIKNDIAKKNVQISTTKNLADTLQKGNTQSTPNIIKVSSALGFDLQFDSLAYESYGQVTDVSSTDKVITGESFADDELKVGRDYSLIRLRPKAVQDSNTYSNPPQLTVSTNIRKDFWASRQSKAGNATKSKIDLLTDFLISTTSEDPALVTSKISDITIGTIAYKKIVVSVSNEKYGIKTPTQTFMYATVQNDRPYWSTISFAASNTPEVAQFESVIRTVSYGTPTSTTLSYEQKKLSLASGPLGLTTTFTLPKNSSNVPEALTQDTLVKVVARNQPSVVRVMLVYCADMQLNDGTNSVEFKDACTWGVGSGSIISSDGYIITNGHVVNVDSRNVLGWGILKSDETMKATLDFMVSAGLMSQANVDALLLGQSKGDKDAISALDNMVNSIPDSMIRANNVVSKYAIQLGDDPLKINETSGPRWTPIYNSTNIEAKLVDQDYDATTSSGALDSNGHATSSDVAILKASGVFPTISLGGIDSVKSGDQLTAIGYPGFVDGGPDTKKSITVPSVTQGTIINRISDGTAQDRQLLTTTVPIAHGNSGGPALNSEGEQIGLNTYSYFNCPDQQCFGNGVVRDIADAKALIAKNKIAVGDFANDTKDWYQALDQYTAGNFEKAITLFETVKKNYPANYMVQPLLQSAKNQLGTSTDTSASYKTVDRLNVVVIIVSAVGAAVIVAIVVLIVIYTRKHRRELIAHTVQTAAI